MLKNIKLVTHCEDAQQTCYIYVIYLWNVSKSSKYIKELFQIIYMYNM